MSPQSSQSFRAHLQIDPAAQYFKQSAVMKLFLELKRNQSMANLILPIGCITPDDNLGIKTTTIPRCPFHRPQAHRQPRPPCLSPPCRPRPPPPPTTPPPPIPPHLTCSAVSLNQRSPPATGCRPICRCQPSRFPNTAFPQRRSPFLIHRLDLLTWFATSRTSPTRWLPRETAWTETTSTLLLPPLLKAPWDRRHLLRRSPAPQLQS